MRCSKARGLFSDYLDRRLDAAQRDALKHHLASCQECRAELALLREAIAALRSLEAPVPPEDFAAQIKERILAVQAASEEPDARAAGSPAWGWALAAAFALAVVVAGRWYINRPLAELGPIWYPSVVRHATSVAGGRMTGSDMGVLPSAPEPVVVTAKGNTEVAPRRRNRALGSAVFKRRVRGRRVRLVACRSRKARSAARAVVEATPPEPAVALEPQLGCSVRSRPGIAPVRLAKAVQAPEVRLSPGLEPRDPLRRPVAFESYAPYQVAPAAPSDSGVTMTTVGESDETLNAIHVLETVTEDDQLSEL